MQEQVTDFGTLRSSQKSLSKWKPIHHRCTLLKMEKAHIHALAPAIAKWRTLNLILYSQLCLMLKNKSDK